MASETTIARMADLHTQVHRLEAENRALRAAMERLTQQNRALVVAREIAIRAGVAPVKAAPVLTYGDV